MEEGITRNKRGKEGSSRWETLAKAPTSLLGELAHKKVWPFYHDIRSYCTV